MDLAKISKIVASGPVIAVECKTLDDVKDMGNQCRDALIKNEILVITGSTPLRQLVEQVPKACLRGLIGLAKVGGGGGGKGGGKTGKAGGGAS